ncbi:MAG: DUF445 domain-containing protein [Bacteroidales bacterium]
MIIEMMAFNWMFVVIPVVGALIGYITNYIAVKMLFHPRKPINILGLKIQGIFVKRQQAIAQSIARMVDKELFSAQDVKDMIVDAENLDSFNVLLSEHIDNFVDDKLPASFPMLSLFLTGGTKTKIKGIFKEEIKNMLPDVGERLADQLGAKIDVERLVQERVENFSVDKLEDMLWSVLSNEFRFIEVIGAVLGFVIGIVQVIILVFV